MTLVTITGPNDPLEVHKAGCRDLGNRRKFREPTYDLEVYSYAELAREVWGDIASDDLDRDSDEWQQRCMEYMDSGYRVMPCVTSI